jgi:hypothetical protein
MTTLFVSSTRTTAVNLESSTYDVLHVTQSGSITTVETSVTGEPGSEVVVDGSLRSEDQAIVFWGAGCALTVGSTGTVRGGTHGIVLADNANVVANNGQISASLTIPTTAHHCRHPPRRFRQSYLQSRNSVGLLRHQRRRRRNRWQSRPHRQYRQDRGNQYRHFPFGSVEPRARRLISRYSLRRVQQRHDRSRCYGSLRGGLRQCNQ